MISEQFKSQLSCLHKTQQVVELLEIKTNLQEI